MINFFLSKFWKMKVIFYYNKKHVKSQIQIIIQCPCMHNGLIKIKRDKVVQQSREFFLVDANQFQFPCFYLNI